VEKMPEERTVNAEFTNVPELIGPLQIQDKDDVENDLKKMGAGG